MNNEKFLIERSADGKVYKAIGEVAGNGTTQEEQSYTFTDEHPLPGVNYYRLKQVDFSGSHEYSKVETVIFRKQGEIAVYPTVVQGEVMVLLPENAVEESTVIIYSLQGALLHQQALQGGGTLTVPLPQLPAGQYMVEVVNGNITQRSLVFKQ